MIELERAVRSLFWGQVQWVASVALLVALAVLVRWLLRRGERHWRAAARALGLDRYPKGRRPAG